MLISLDKKFIYFHYPKTGGSTIQHTLQDYGYVTNTELLKQKEKRLWGLLNKGEIPKHHSSNSELGKKLLSYYTDFLVFGSVRNPWDLVISTIKFRPDLYQNTNKQTIMEYGGNHIFKNNGTMSSFYTPDTKIVKMENLYEDLNTILNPLGIEFELKSVNINRVNDDYRQYYDDESKDYIANLFKDDIKNFKYEF